MEPAGNGEGTGSSFTLPVDSVTPHGYNRNTHVSLQVSTSKRGLLCDDERSPIDFCDGATSFSSRLRPLKYNPLGIKACPSPESRSVVEGKDGIFRSIPSRGLQKRFKRVLSRKIDWSSVMQMCKKWIRKPLNMALFVWMIGVAVSGAILFLVMTGMLNHSLPKKSRRDTWFEVNNQIINALFTLMCLYQHPKRIHHLVLLGRWKPEDVAQLRKIYCKNGTYKPKEWMHIMVVVILLHINCFAQYALCVLNLGYKRSERPIIGVAICLSVAIGAPAIAGLYCMISPLGKDYECDADEESAYQLGRKSLETKFIFAPREELGVVGGGPEWRGGLFHLWEDFCVAYISIFCCFCVFGWNMERLGFGNMYVHIATFILFCMAPFLIFNLAAVNLDNDTVREIMGLTGIALCVFGSLYGGFWRIQMRKRFNLPPNNFCFRKPDLSDCVSWLFCCWCSLAQEVRTGDSYDIVEKRFYNKEHPNNHTPMTPLPRESSSMSDAGSSSVWMNSSLSNAKPSVTNEIMAPPIPSSMRIELENSRKT